MCILDISGRGRSSQTCSVTEIRRSASRLRQTAGNCCYPRRGILPLFYRQGKRHSSWYTANAREPTFSHVSAGSSFTDFQPVSIDDAIAAIGRLPDKCSSADQLLVCILKSDASELAPFMTELFNRALAAECFPQICQEA
jgi:hypothetical protein